MKSFVQSRRNFLRGSSGVLGTAALGQLFGQGLAGAEKANTPGVESFPQGDPKAKRVIFLFQAGGPSQMDLVDYKPMLRKYHGQELPKSVMGDTKFTGMVNGQASFPVVASPWEFKQYGQSGMWASELMPHLGSVADDICMINSMTTTQVDHDAAITFLQTGHQFSGRPSAGAWVSYGLGSECDDLPAFVVLMSDNGGAFLQDRHWGAGFLPSKYQGVRFGATAGEAVPFLSNPKGMDTEFRRRTLDDLAKLNRLRFEETLDPEIETRISQYEMAFRMQMSVPDLTDVSDEPESTFKLYGEEAKEKGTYANCCLVARRLAERGVRFTQVFQRGWDHHRNLPKNIVEFADCSDRANAALVTDLKQRGLLEDTLVVWGGEFGRTVFCQGKLTKDDFGREHHAKVFSMWLAGGGTKPGLVYGKSDEWSFHAAENPVPVHDLHATMMHLLGINHKRLTYRFQGRDYRLTDLAGNVVKGVLA